MTENQNNPLLYNPKPNKYDAFPFAEIKNEHFKPAFEVAISEAKVMLGEIRNNKEAPNFENTIFALENCSELLEEVGSVFFNLLSSNGDEEMRQLAQVFSPMLAEFDGQIHTDDKLFQRVKSVYDTVDSLQLNEEQKRLVEYHYKRFARNGALLNDEKKETLQQINMEMAVLGQQYSQNVLKDTNTYEKYITDENLLLGLPESAIEAAATTARQKGKDGGWVFTLQMPSLLPVLDYAENRDLRKELTIATGKKATTGETDNREILKKIAILRQQRAELLGYPTHADYVLEERMAENPATVLQFIDSIYEAAYEPAKSEMQNIQALAEELDNLPQLEAWDVNYYQEKLKQKLFQFDEEELKPYFLAENVISGVFKVAEKMYNLHFEKLSSIDVYHPDVTVYEVTDSRGKFVGLLYLDLYPRETKRAGAWMTTFRGQGWRKGEVQRPHVLIVANVTPSTDQKPSLLRFREVTTIFHEFGHALHSLLSDCVYPSLASPNVYWDFVELPSQIMENWVSEKETLALFATHYQTGEMIPDTLIEKVKASQNFCAGLSNLNQLRLGSLDMAWHANNPSGVTDVEAFENQVLERYTFVPAVAGLIRSCSFSHIFAGGYSSGYYSYKWAEVLDADAFSLFQEKGIFNQEVAASFRDNILSQGNRKHPMDLFIAFRGRRPDSKALLRRDGLLK